MRLVYLAAAWTLGIIAATESALRIPLAWAVLVLLAGGFAFFWRRMRGGLHGESWLWFIVIAAGALGGLRMSSAPITSEIAALNNSGGMTLTGIVVAPLDRRDDRTLLRLEVETVTRRGETSPTSGLVLVEAPRSTPARYGDRIAATGLLVTPFTGDRFSYADYLARGSIYSLLRESAVEIIEAGARTNWRSSLIDLNNRIAAQIGALLPEPQAGLLTGILLGNERGIAPEVRDAFAVTGAAHVIAISGFNMTVLSGVVIGILRRLNAPRTASVLIALAVVAVYTIFVGANAAVARAALMSSALIIGRSLRRRTFIPASLALTVMLLSAFNPHVLWDVGFQLSFFSTLGIALFTEPLSRALDGILVWLQVGRWRQQIANLVQEPLIVSAAALVLTLPLTALYFGHIALSALLVNLLIVPVQPAVLLLGMSAALIGLITPPVAQIIYWLDMLFLSWTIAVVRLFAVIPALEVFPHPNLITIFFVTIMLAAGVRAARPAWAERMAKTLRARPIIALVLVSGGALFVFSAALFAARPDGRLHVWFLNVGHSNAVLIATPEGAHILIDGGRNPSRLLTAIGERMPFNKRALDLMIWTQPDSNELSALAAVIERYDVAMVIDNGAEVLSEWYTSLIDRIASPQRVSVAVGYTLDLSDGVRIEIMNPPRTPAFGASLDDHALVVRLHYGETSFLFTGDLSASAQTRLAQGDPRALILQIPQHGTARGVDHGFVRAVDAGIIVIQAQRDNPRGDPNPDVIATLPNVPLFRTDQHGVIHFISDGTALIVETER